MLQVLKVRVQVRVRVPMSRVQVSELSASTFRVILYYTQYTAY